MLGSNNRHKHDYVEYLSKARKMEQYLSSTDYDNYFYHNLKTSHLSKKSDMFIIIECA